MMVDQEMYRKLFRKRFERYQWRCGDLNYISRIRKKWNCSPEFISGLLFWIWTQDREGPIARLESQAQEFSKFLSDKGLDCRNLERTIEEIKRTPIAAEGRARKQGEEEAIREWL